MAPLDQSAKDAIISTILQELEGTKFACQNLYELHGGTANFTFRGILKHPLDRSDGGPVTTVIVKHSTDFAAINKDFPMPISRCFFEQCTLVALKGFQSSANPATVVKVPDLLLFKQQQHIQVLEDFPRSTDLKGVLVSPNNNDLIDHETAVSIGCELGSWLRAFHSWADGPAQAELRKTVAQNEEMRNIKYGITYQSFLSVLEDFPDLLQGHSEALKEVESIAAMELQSPPIPEQGNCWGLIHGDFWTGNVLVPNDGFLVRPGLGKTELYIIDWELCQIGHRAMDLGQMVCDLYERKHFRNFEAAVPTIEAFIGSYGNITKDLAFATAIYTGVHLICWYTRRPRKGPMVGTPDKIKGAMELGRDFILKGAQRDEIWFLSSPLASLFTPKMATMTI